MGGPQVPSLRHVVLMLPVKPGVQLVRHTAPAPKLMQPAGKAVLLLGAGGGCALHRTMEGDRQQHGSH